MQKDSRGFLPIWVFLLVAIGITAAAVVSFPRSSKKVPEATIPLNEELSPSPSVAPDEFADWKTYRNEEYGFEFKYPAEFTLDNPSVLRPGYPGQTWIKFSQMTLKIHDNTKNLSLVDWFMQHVDYQNILAKNRSYMLLESPLGKVYKQQQSGLPMEYIDERPSPGQILFLSPSGAQIFEIFTYPSGQAVNSAELADKILSTFRFIPSTSSGQVEKDDTANWKTYRNEEYGFEVKYPSDYEVRENPFDHQGIFILNNKYKNNLVLFRNSSLGIVPQGELDYGAGYDTPPKITKIAGKNAREISSSEIKNGGAVLYMFTDFIKNWKQCGEDFIKCGRIELLAVDDKDLKTLNQILSTFRFIEPLTLEERQQLLDAAQKYVLVHSVQGLNFNIELARRVGNFARVLITPTNMDLDTVQVILEKVNKMWVARDMGTGFAGWYTKVPELFD